jgi:ribonuclease BN (tRNA processing enzyme)
MSFRIVPLGVGDAFSALHYSTCVALEAADSLVLIDCPHPIQKMMREARLASIDPKRISAVILTHLHADHCSGIEGLGYWTFFYQKRKLPLFLHADVLRDLWHGHLAAGMSHLMPSPGAPTIDMKLEDYFELHLLDENAAIECGPFSIESKKTIHHVPTTALRIRAEGRVLGHSADTAFDQSLIDWLAEADLVVHETNYGVHTPYEKLAALPPELRAKMKLIHYPDDFDLAASNIEPLQQGRVYVV